MTAPRKLLLWDIDGTLINSGGAGVHSLALALKKEFGLDYDTANAELDVAGRTDRYISEAMLERFGVDPTPENIHRFLEGYLLHLPVELSQRNGWVLHGVVEILEEAHRRPDITQGLLTGNLRRGAHLKLSHFKIHHYFEFGAFADDSALRNELGPHALRRAGELTGHTFDLEHVYVIGDTPHDIACGKAIGAKTIAVATGTFSATELEKHNPTATFADFAHPQSFFDLIG